MGTFEVIAAFVVVGALAYFFYPRAPKDQLPPSWKPRHDGDVFHDQLDKERAARRDRG